MAFYSTLTGFKWIARAPGMVYGFEEALGYLVNPQTVRDKDGISAAVAILGLIAEAREQGQTLADLLAAFQETFGFFDSTQVSVRVEDTAIIGRIMAGLRADAPHDLGGVAVDRIEDFLTGVGDFPPSDVLRVWLTDGSRVIIRPSGTEPKLKIYIDVRGDSAQDSHDRIAALTAASNALIDQHS